MAVKVELSPMSPYDSVCSQSSDSNRKIDVLLTVENVNSLNTVMSRVPNFPNPTFSFKVVEPIKRSESPSYTSMCNDWLGRY